MHLTQRRITILVFSWLIGLAIIALPMYAFIERDSFSMMLVACILAICIVLLAAFLRGWPYAEHVLVLLIALIAPLGATAFNLTEAPSPVILIPVSLALLLLNPWWVGGIAALMLGLYTARAGFPNPYLDPTFLMSYAAIVGFMILSRLAVDSAVQLEAARNQAEAARQEAEAARHDAEERAREIEARSREQQRLLELVAALETPTVEIADRVLLASLVGSLDPGRLARVSSALLEAASARRPELVVIDVAGLTHIDTQASHGLIQIVRSLRLLGCPVTLTGISSEVALMLTRLQVDLSEVPTTRSPQEALRLHLRNHTALVA